MDVYYLPGKSVNSYVSNMMGLLSKHHNVYPMLEVSDLKGFFLNLHNYKESVIFLNWFEDQTSLRTNVFKIFYRILYLFMLRLFFKKVIWVKHNFKPHNENNMLIYNLFCFLLKLICNEKIAHRELSGYSYIPHPLYHNNLKVKSFKERDVDYLYFGVISRYKGLDKLLQKWPVEKKLVIRGACQDDKLYSEIIKIINDRCLDVDIRNKFLPEIELNLLINNSKYVVLPHNDKTMVVSGTFYHAASLGANVLMHNNGFYIFCKSKFNFVTEFDFQNESEYIQPNIVLEEITKECSNESVLFLLNKILKDNF